MTEIKERKSVLGSKAKKQNVCKKILVWSSNEDEIEYDIIDSSDDYLVDIERLFSDDNEMYQYDSIAPGDFVIAPGWNQPTILLRKL